MERKYGIGITRNMDCFRVARLAELLLEDSDISLKAEELIDQGIEKRIGLA